MPVLVSLGQRVTPRHPYPIDIKLVIEKGDGT